MARVATSQLAREAAEIRADDRFLIDQPTVVNPVTSQPGDTRKVSPAVLAEGMAQQTAVITMVQNRIDSRTGSLDDLTTGSKTNLVSAINEVNGECDTNAAAIAAEETRAKGVEGALTGLTTTDQTNLFAAINELNGELDSFPALIRTLDGKYNIGSLAGAYITALQ
jgi:hypothetical protein